MASQQPDAMQGTAISTAVYNANPLDKCLDKHKEFEEKIRDRGDYSGAVAKTDPAEKRLVRKLDIWIMVSPRPKKLFTS